MNDSVGCAPIIDYQSRPEPKSKQQLEPRLIDSTANAKHYSSNVHLDSILEEDNSNPSADSIEQTPQLIRNSSNSLAIKQHSIKAPPTTETKPTLSIFSKILQSAQSKTASIETKSPSEAHGCTRATPLTSHAKSGENGRKFSPFEERLNEICKEADTSKSALSTTTSSSVQPTNRGTGACAMLPTVESTTKAVGHVSILDDTPLKTFQVPNPKRVLSTQRPVGLPHRRRPALESEFRSQKILFTTPTAVSRPTIALMSHVGLDDSLNCYKSPSTTLLRDVEEPSRSILRPVENNVDFGKTEHKAVEQIRVKPPEEVKPSAGDKIDGMQAKSDENSCSEEEKTTIKINGKDFILQKKIGQGGSCSVFLAVHKNTGRECALKVSQIESTASSVIQY